MARSQDKRLRFSSSPYCWASPLEFERPSDDTIAKDVQGKLAADPATKDSAVAVSAQTAGYAERQRQGLAAKQRVEQIGTDEPEPPAWTMKLR